MTAEPPKQRRLTTTGVVVTAACTAVTLGIGFLLFPFVSPALRKHCLPFVPATDAQIENVLAAVRRRPGLGNLVDLGSGDGRIVIAAAKQGIPSLGYELNYWLVLFSRYRAYREGVFSTAKFARANLWNVSLRPFDNIVIFGVSGMMRELQGKVFSEMHSTSQVIACRFPFVQLQSASKIGHGIDTVWCYNKHSKALQPGQEETEEVMMEEEHQSPEITQRK